jgi:transposase InsO family protein
MFDQHGFLAWSSRNGLSDQTCSTIECIRKSEPSRRVGGGRHNVTGRYPSKKMGVTIQFESHRVELPAIYELEHDADVIEYFDQAPSIKLDYSSADGKRLGVLHTPDFFVIRQSSAGWEECKTEDDLRRLVAHNPNRYCRREDRWVCPPGEAHAQTVGLYYRVRSSSEIQWMFQRNIQFLEDYLRSSTVVSSASREKVLALVAATPGITLQAVFGSLEETVSRDEVFALLATGDIYVDLCAASLAEPGKVALFSEHLCESAASRNIGTSRIPLPIILRAGHLLKWDGNACSIVNVGKSAVSVLMEGRTLMELPLDTLEDAIKQGRVTIASQDLSDPNSGHVLARLSQAAESDLKTATERCGIVCRFLRGQREFSVPERTVRRWVVAYRNAEDQLGNGYLGLLPAPNVGNPVSKLPEATRSLMMEFLDKDYETLKQKTQYATWGALRLACERQGIVSPSFKTFSIAVRQRPGFEQTLKRKGPRAAYQLEPFYWELEQSTPRLGDRPFEIVHIDHTQMDVWAVCTQTGRPLGRPWLTLMTDAFSRRILSIYLTFDPPSYRSCMMVLRECVRRHCRFPQTIVVDGGREFQSGYFESLLARYECTKKCRPPAKARFGATCERLFGTTNKQLIHNLQGNTQISRQVRQVTNGIDPESQAIWPLKELHQRLVEYAYEIYDTVDHPALGQSPRAAMDDGFLRSGMRLHRIVPYDHEFHIFTLPTTRKGTAQVSLGRGVKIHYLYYWCEAFRDPSVENTRVAVRYDPFDAGTAYAFVNNRWSECHSEYYTTFQSHSERELQLVTEELLKRRKNHSGQTCITAKKLAEFLESVEKEENILAQRLSDLETRSIYSSSPAAPSKQRTTVPSNNEPVLPKPAPAQVSPSYSTYGEM